MSFTLYLYITPYKINLFWSKFNLISSIMDLYVLHTMFGKDDYLTVSKLHTACCYHNYFEIYELLNMFTPNKMVNMVKTISLAS